ncbi:hypothetical protein KR51_00016770, partial [Rubidibacter lacunae KORDI 51-2]
MQALPNLKHELLAAMQTRCLLALRAQPCFTPSACI